MVDALGKQLVGEHEQEAINAKYIFYSECRPWKTRRNKHDMLSNT